jgi:transketolase
MPTDPLPAKWASMGWEVAQLDGHDWPQVLGALDRACERRDRPLVLIAHTVKGYGVSQIEEDTGNKYHGVPLKPDEAERAIREIEAA